MTPIPTRPTSLQADDPFTDPAVVNPDPGVLTVWSDIGCPWASLALHQLHARAVERHMDLVVDHRAFPLELFNQRPTPKGIIDVEVTAIVGLVPTLGWRPWSTPDSQYAVSTVPAMAAVQAAKLPSVGGLRASHELDAALRDALYIEHRCISIHSEILRAASKCSAVNVEALDEALQTGAGYADVFAQWRTARELPVQGSPHLFVTDQYAEHNPGVDYHWTAPPGEGFPRFDAYDPSWSDVILNLTSS